MSSPTKENSAICSCVRDNSESLPSLPEGAALNNEKLAHRPSVDHGKGDTDEECTDTEMHPHAMPPPSPLVTRRNRRLSLSERAARGPVKVGKVKWFCRQRGHGFITPNDGGDDLFVHVTDIEGEFAPHDGDEVAFKLCPCPPSFEKFQATHVTIRNLAPGVRHEKWSEPPTPHAHPHAAPNIPENRLSLSKEDIETLQHHSDD